MAEVAVPTPDGVPLTTHLTRERIHKLDNDHVARPHEHTDEDKNIDVQSSPPVNPVLDVVSKPEYPAPLPLAVILVSLMLAMFPVALDMVSTIHSLRGHH